MRSTGQLRRKLLSKTNIKSYIINNIDLVSHIFINFQNKEKLDNKML
jgi:hypothetical protein